MRKTCLTIILAAGEGTRMKSATPKVLHEVAGLPMVVHVLNAANQAGGDKSVVVVGAGADNVASKINNWNNEVSIVIQNERLGTAHAVLAADEWLRQSFDDVLILYGDVPLIQAKTLHNMRHELQNGADLVVLGFEAANPTGYGRLIVDDGQLVAIREHKDASDDEKTISLCNSGIMGFNGSIASELIRAIENNNSQNEYYLTDAVSIARSKGLKVVATTVAEEDVQGVNNRVQLAEVEAVWQQRKRKEMMLNGVSMPAPETVQFAHDTEIGRDTIVEPNVVFASGVSVAENATIRAFSHLEGAEIGEGCIVGPYARLRPGTSMLHGSKVGNFCEVKKATIGIGSKVNHLSYIGDTIIGTKANIGAGTITCNYDGINKHQTKIGNNAFIGSNSSLVAPVEIGDNAIVAAGSVVTKDVPQDALGISRGKQINKDHLAGKIRLRNEAKKNAG